MANASFGLMTTKLILLLYYFTVDYLISTFETFYCCFNIFIFIFNKTFAVLQA